MRRGRHWTPEDLEALQRRRSGARVLGPCSSPANVLSAAIKPTRKYGNQPIEAEGQRWDSHWEYECWRQLCLRERTGEIRGLRRQVRFPLHVNNVRVGHYVSDFIWLDANGRTHCADAKGLQTQLFRWKARHFEAEYGYPIEILELP